MFISLLLWPAFGKQFLALCCLLVINHVYQIAPFLFTKKRGAVMAKNKFTNCHYDAI
jgi:hypothetical protein